MELFIVFVIVALIWLLLASIFDLKTREVPNWLSFSLISIGLGGRLIFSFVKNDFSYLVYGFIGFAVYFVFGIIMYYTKQWGGGDAKLLSGLGFMFGNYESVIFNPNLYFNFLFELLMNILIAGAVIGIIYSIILTLKNYSKFKKEVGKLDPRLGYFVIGIFAFINLIAYFSLDLMLFIMQFYFGLTVLVAAMLILYMRIVDKSCMIRKINISKLTEGDWLVENGKIVEATLKRIEELHYNKVKNVVVRYGIPFVPSFFVGFLITIIVGNWWIRFLIM